MSAQANYASTPKIGVAVVTTGDTSRTAPATFVTVLTAGTNGTRINSIALQAIGATIASVIRLFLYNGTTLYEWQEFQVIVNPAAVGNTAFNQYFSAFNASTWLPLVLPAGWSIRATINDTQPTSGVNIIIGAGDL